MLQRLRKKEKKKEEKTHNYLNHCTHSRPKHTHFSYGGRKEGHAQFGFQSEVSTIKYLIPIAAALPTTG